MPEFKVKNIYAICKILAMGATKFITGKKERNKFSKYNHTNNRKHSK